MRNEVFEDLNRRDPRLALVGDSCFSANTHDHLIMMHAVDEMTQR